MKILNYLHRWHVSCYYKAGEMWIFILSWPALTVVLTTFWSSDFESEAKIVSSVPEMGRGVGDRMYSIVWPDFGNPWISLTYQICAVMVRYLIYVLHPIRHDSLCFMPFSFTPFCFNTSFQFTPLLNLCSLFFLVNTLWL